MSKPRYKFPVANCPLCDKELATLNGMFGPSLFIWQCNENVVPNNGRPLPHYQVEWDKQTGTIVQHVVVGQFYIDTFNTDWQTRISVANPWGGSYGPSNPAKHVMTVPQLRIDKPDKLLERVKTLIIFS